MLPKPTLISTRTALLALEQQCTILRDAETVVTAERLTRDDLIYDALEAGISYPKVEGLTGLSKSALYKIKTHHVRNREDNIDTTA